MWVYLFTASILCALHGAIWQGLPALASFTMASVFATGAAICASIDGFRSMVEKIARFAIKRSEPERQDSPQADRTYSRKAER